MKIDQTLLGAEELILEEDIPAEDLDLDTSMIKFHEIIKVRARLTKITNTIDINLVIDTDMQGICSRCLEEFIRPIHKEMHFNLVADKNERFIDLDPHIREEIILDYPIKLLCKEDCKGICVICGENINKGGCRCGST